MLLSSAQGGMTAVFKKILQEQILSLRDGDRFWYENRSAFPVIDENGSEISELGPLIL